MANYPDKPTRVSGYTEKWVESYLEEKATSTQIRKFRKACEGKEAWKERRAVFVEMFIKEETAGKEKKPRKTFDDKLLEMEKKKRAAEKAAKAAQASADK